jgi:hypothetical protein
VASGDIFKKDMSRLKVFLELQRNKKRIRDNEISFSDITTKIAFKEHYRL